MHQYHGQNQVDRSELSAQLMLADLLAPDDKRYVMACEECNTAIFREQNSAVVKRARDDDRTQNCTCGGEYVMVRDCPPGDES